MILTLISALLFGPQLYEEKHWPQPTKEMAALVNQMGSRSFRLREAATGKLEKLGYKALLALRRGWRGQDVEIVRRCAKLIENYLTLRPTQGGFESVFKLPFGTKLPAGKRAVEITQERAEFFYREQLRLCNLFDGGYYNEDVACQATQLYVRELLRQGVDKKSLLGLIDGMPDREADIPLTIMQNNGN